MRSKKSCTLALLVMTMAAVGGRVAADPPAVFSQLQFAQADAAKRGDPEAQFRLGKAHWIGDGIPKDHGEAVRWFRKAAEQGLAKAQAYLAYAYRYGNGVKLDQQQAAKWNRRAAEQGNARAQKNLGNAYRDGRGVRQSHKEAFKWYRKSAEQGYSAAQNTLGFVHRNGRGVARDHREAVKWFRKAADQGDSVAPIAQYNLGDMYLKGLGVTKNRSKAISLFREAARQDESHAIEALRELGVAVATPGLESAGPGKADIVAVQRALARLGYDPGAADGQVGPRTRNAIRQFQRDSGLDANNTNITPELVANLERRATTKGNAGQSNVSAGPSSKQEKSAPLGDIGDLDTF